MSYSHFHKGLCVSSYSAFWTPWSITTKISYILATSSYCSNKKNLALLACILLSCGFVFSCTFYPKGPKNGIDVFFFGCLVDFVFRESKRNHKLKLKVRIKPESHIVKQHTVQMSYFTGPHVPFVFHGHFQITRN